MFTAVEMELHNTFADALGKPRIVAGVVWGVRRTGTPTFTTVPSVADAITLLRTMDDELTISDLSCGYNADGEIDLEIFQGATLPSLNYLDYRINPDDYQIQIGHEKYR